MPWIWHGKISIVCTTDSAQQNASAAKLPRPSFPALLLFTVMKNLQQSNIFFKSTKFVRWSSFLSRTTSLLNNAVFKIVLPKQDYRIHHAIHRNTETSYCSSSWLCTSFPPASALDPAHFSGHLTDNRAPSIMSLFYQRKVFYKIRSHTVTPCLVLDHQASASGFCAVSTKTDLIMKSKGDSNDALESIKLFLKQNAPWWTCDVMSGGLALGLFQMKCHLWTLHITELPGLKEVI